MFGLKPSGCCLFSEPSCGFTCPCVHHLTFSISFRPRPSKHLCGVHYSLADLIIHNVWFQAGVVYFLSPALVRLSAFAVVIIGTRRVPDLQHATLSMQLYLKGFPLESECSWNLSSVLCFRALI